MVKKEQPSGEESCILKDASVWEQAFENERREGGLLSGVSGPISPNHVLEELRIARDASLKAQTEVTALKQQLARAASETATRFRDELLLREDLHAARSAGEPNVLQLKQLLLEPAVNREFSRLSTRLEAVQRERNALQEELRVIQMSVSSMFRSLCSYFNTFTTQIGYSNSSSHYPKLQLVSTDPKAPNVMAQQVRQLEERCEALGHEAIESRAESLEKSLTIARKQLEDMRRQYGGKHSICRL